MSTFTSFAVLWTAIAAITLGLAFYRRLISANEIDVVHLAASEAGDIPKQEALAARLNVIDRWGKTLTVVTVLLGLVLASTYLFHVWVEAGSKPHFS